MNTGMTNNTMLYTPELARYECNTAVEADLYDALELESLAHGGIGAGNDFERPSLVGKSVVGFYQALVPNCAHGMLLDAAGLLHEAHMDERIPGTWFDDSLSLRLSHVYDVTRHKSDMAVRAINRRNGAQDLARVPFDEWARELHLVRADA